MLLKEINNQWQTSNIRIGASIDSQLGLELDSIVVVATNITENSNFNINKYDTVLFTDLDDKTYCMMVAKYQKKYISYNPIVFEYEIHLMSLTKRFENIPMPCRAITNIGQNRTVEFFIKQGLDYYEKDYSWNGLTKIFENYDLSVQSTEMPIELTTMICPEMQFNKPTLRQYLDSLYQLAGCISVLKFKQVGGGGGYFYLSYLDLNERKSAIDLTYVNDMTETNPAEDYASEVETQLDKVISKDEKIEYQVLKSEDGFVHTGNAVILTDSPIYDIKKVYPFNFNIKITVSAHVQNDLIAPTIDRWDDLTLWFNNETLKLDSASGQTIISESYDISKFIVIDQVYQSLETATTKFGSGQYYQEGLYTNNTLSYKRGDNKIDGLFDYQKKTWLLDNNDIERIKTVIYQSVIRGLIQDLVGHYYTLHFTPSGLPAGDYIVSFTEERLKQNSHLLSTDIDYKSIYFRVHYLDFEANKMRLEREKDRTHNVIATTNQSDSNINMSSFIARQKEVINQSGNPILEFSALVPMKYNSTIHYEVGQTFDIDWVLVALEKACFIDSVFYKGVFTKNYVCENLFTQIERDKRYFTIANNDVVVRHELRVVDYGVDVETTLTKYDLDSEDALICLPMTWAKITSKIDENTSLKAVLVPDLVNENNIIAYTVAPLDNVSVGVARTGNTLEYNSSQVPTLEYVKYADDNGECENITIGLYNNIPNYKTFADNYPKATAINNIDSQTPNFEFDLENDPDMTGIPFFKDNREHLKVTHQHRYMSLNSNVIIGPAFAKLLTNSNIGQILTNEIVTNRTKTDGYNVYTNASSVVFYDGDKFYLKLQKGGSSTGKNLIVFCDEGLILGVNDFDTLTEDTNGIAYITLYK